MRDGYEVRAAWTFWPITATRPAGRYRGCISAYWDRSFLRDEWRCDHEHDGRDAAVECGQTEYDRQLAAGERQVPTWQAK